MSDGIARRTVVKLIVAVAGTPALLTACGGLSGKALGTAPARRAGPAGTLTDPDLVHPIVPWKLTLDAGQREMLALLCDLIIPTDDHSPSAGALGAPAFIDEWVSAPFEDMQKDAVVVRDGLVWLDAEAQHRFGAGFRSLEAAQQSTLCAAICDINTAPRELQDAAYFFDRVRELTVIAFYTTREGMADIGYVGNVPLDAWSAPPLEVLRLVGLE